MLTDDDLDDLLLSCRYGDLEDVQRFVDAFSTDALIAAHDDRRNTPLHMAAANGHTDILAYLLPLLPAQVLVAQNDAGSTPLHWATLNRHLDAMRALVTCPTGPGVDMIDIKNAAGRTPLGEAEIAAWDEGARWLVQVMKLDDTGVTESDDAPVDPSQAIHVEIQDADGQMASMTLSGKPSAPDQPSCRDLPLPATSPDRALHHQDHSAS